MPAYYWYHCDTCEYRAERYRNVKRCKCGGNLIREEPQSALTLIEKIEAVVPYVLATIGRNSFIPDCERKDWGCIHRGRADSSERQLQSLLNLAREIKVVSAKREEQ